MCINNYQMNNVNIGIGERIFDQLVSILDNYEIHNKFATIDNKNLTQKIYYTTKHNIIGFENNARFMINYLSSTFLYSMTKNIILDDITITTIDDYVGMKKIFKIKKKIIDINSREFIKFVVDHFPEINDWMSYNDKIKYTLGLDVYLHFCYADKTMF